jgi:integrase
MTETIAGAVERFIAHKRAHGRKYHSEARELALLVRFAAGHDVSCLGGLTPALLEEFLASRPRPHPRSFNHLLGVVRCLLDWAVTWQLLEASPLQARRHRVTAARIPFLFDPAQARQLLDAAAALADGPRAPARGPTYHAIFALCYGLGLRAGEACGLRLGDVDAGRSLLIVRGGKFGKSRLVPHGPRIAALVSEQAARRARAAGMDTQAPLFTFDGRRPVHPGTASQAFHHLVATLELPVPDGVSPPRLHDLRH